MNGLVPTVISFEPHSNYVLREPGDPLLLTTTKEKREFVESLGLELIKYAVLAAAGYFLAKLM